MGKYSADVTEQFLNLNDVTFMVRRFDWTNKDDSHSFDYAVYQPIDSYFGNFSTVTTYNEQLWGMVDSHFDESQFENLAYMSDERYKQVKIYQTMRDSVANEIAAIAIDKGEWS